MRRKLVASLLVLAVLSCFLVPAFATPTTIATSTSATAVSSPQERGPLYVNGYYWMFFSDGTNFKCFSSADASTFAVASGWVNLAATSANRFSIAYDPLNDNFCYAYTPSTLSGLRWRQGSLNNDGSVSWDAAQQTVASLTVPFYPSVCYDTSGIAWVGLTFQYASGDYRWRVYLNTATDGTWSTDANYPVDLLTTQSTGVRGVILGMSANDAITLYAKATPTIYSWELDYGGKKSGSSEETASDSAAYTADAWSATKKLEQALGEGDVIILVWHKTSTSDFRCAIRSGGSWAASSQIYDTSISGAIGPSVSVDTATGYIYCVVPKVISSTTYTYFVSTDGGSGWDAGTSVEEPTGFYDYLTLQASFQCYGSKLCVAWLQSGTSPRNVRFDAIDLAIGPSEWTWRLGTSTVAYGSRRWIVQKTFQKTGLTDSVESKRFLMWFCWHESTVSVSFSHVFYQRLLFVFSPHGLSESVGSERIIRTLPFQQHYDDSESFSGLGLLMHFRYGESSSSVSVGSREFVKQLVFRQTGVTEGFGSVLWTKVIGFVVWTETGVTESVGSVSWTISAVQSHLVLVMAILVALGFMFAVIFLAYRRRNE